MKSTIGLDQMIQFPQASIRRALNLIFLAASLIGLAWQLGLGPDVIQVKAAGGCAGVTQVPTTECQALVALYNSTNGPGWTNKTNWLDFGMDAPCNWFGVACSEGHVRSLFLEYNGLSGSLPSQLGNLSNLKSLALASNQIRGSIPTQLGNLSHLEYLDISDNKLAGTIPPQLANLTNLTSLNLSHNQLSGSIPSRLGNLTNLVELVLSTNQLSGTIPSRLGSLSNLERLDLSYNRLSGSIPPQLGNFPNMIWLYLSNNRLSGRIPTELGPARAVSLDHNQLTGGLPSDLGDLNHVGYLNLDHNPLGGSIPPQLSNFTGVSLSLAATQLSGSIPPQLGNLTGIESLDLSDNQLNGNIPSELGNLSELDGLALSHNRLSGNIPSQLGNLTYLWGLYLDHNQLSGSIPSQLGNLTYLGELYLDHNQLSGSLPLSFMPSYLEYFTFDHTKLCEPPNPAYQTWLGGVEFLRTTGVVCNHPGGFVTFEIPALGAKPRQLVNPFVDTATGVKFRANPAGFGDEVVGLVKNSATSACVVGSWDDNQKLGTGRSSLSQAGGVGLSSFPIKAIFPSPLAPQVTVSVEFQAPEGAVVRLRLFNASGTKVASVTGIVPPGSVCQFPGENMARTRIATTSTQRVAYAIMDITSGDKVFVIDNFKFFFSNQTTIAEPPPITTTTTILPSSLIYLPLLTK